MRCCFQSFLFSFTKSFSWVTQSMTRLKYYSHSNLKLSSWFSRSQTTVFVSLHLKTWNSEFIHLIIVPLPCQKKKKKSIWKLVWDFYFLLLLFFVIENLSWVKFAMISLFWHFVSNFGHLAICFVSSSYWGFQTVLDSLLWIVCSWVHLTEWFLFFKCLTKSLLRPCLPCVPLENSVSVKYEKFCP